MNDNIIVSVKINIYVNIKLIFDLLFKINIQLEHLKILILILI